MPNMKDLSLKVKKLWPMLKFFDGQKDGRTDRQKDRVITIVRRGPKNRSFIDGFLNPSSQ